ncbi:MAG: hypothetical protein ACK6EB_45450, partial [Planctomyces sp.]
AVPNVFFERLASHVMRSIESELGYAIPIARIVVGFPALITRGVAARTVNLTVGADGDGGSWVETNVQRLIADAFDVDHASVTVVNDMIAGIAGFVEWEWSCNEGDHMAYVSMGGGCGVSEAFALSDRVVLKPTEMGHMCGVPRRAYDDGAVVASATRVQSTLEAEFCSIRAIEKLHREVTGKSFKCHEILDAWESGTLTHSDVVIDRVIEGLALLGTQLTVSGVRLIVIAGHLANRLNRGCIKNLKKTIDELVKVRMRSLCREDLLRGVQVVVFDAIDNTEAKMLLHQGAAVSESTGWVEVPSTVLHAATQWKSYGDRRLELSDV